jgi:hypothetical protein
MGFLIIPLSAPSWSWVEAESIARIFIPRIEMGQL